MKLLVVQLAVTLGLLVVHGCGNQPEQPAQNPTSDNANIQKSIKNNTPPISSDSTHNHQGTTSQSPSPPATTTVKLTSTPKVSSTQGVPLEIQVKNQTGKPVEKFATPQEKPMHMIVVSDDLRFFNHIHPDYQGQGKFAIKHDFPAPGNYTLFTDYQPSGQREQVSVEKISIPGDVPLPSSLETFSDTQTVGNTKVQLKTSPSQLKSGQQSKFSFSLIDTVSKKPVTDLQTYLGRQAHLVIIRSSSPLTANDYIHVHSLNTETKSEMQFQSQLPQKGTYKMWLQFQRQGKITTVPFWINVN